MTRTSRHQQRQGGGGGQVRTTAMIGDLLQVLRPGCRERDALVQPAAERRQGLRRLNQGLGAHHQALGWQPGRASAPINGHCPCRQVAHLAADVLCAGKSETKAPGNGAGADLFYGAAAAGEGGVLSPRSQVAAELDRAVEGLPPTIIYIYICLLPARRRRHAT